MQGIYDLGGMDGFTLPERDEAPVFREEWESQVWGLLFSLALPGVSTGGRIAIENIPPALYLGMPYYARWLYIQEQALLESGVVTDEELSNPNGRLTIPELPDFRPPSPAEVVGFLSQDASALLDLDVPPRFLVDQSVRVTDAYPIGHTRAPGYVRGRRGTILRDNGVYPFEDALPPGVQRRPQHVYTVRFTGPELWGARGHTADRIHVDLWESHLEALD